MTELSLRERNKQRVRERILSATIDLFQAQGYNQTTIDEIAEHAEISRGTLFNYFPSKDSLLLPFVKEVFANRIHPNLLEHLKTQPTTSEALRFLISDIRDDILNVRGLDHAFQEQFVLSKIHSTPLEIGDDAGFLDTIIEIMRYGRQREEVRSDIALEMQARYVGVLFISTFSQLVLQTEATDYTLEIDSLLSFIQAGLQAQ